MKLSKKLWLRLTGRGFYVNILDRGTQIMRTCEMPLIVSGNILSYWEEVLSRTKLQAVGAGVTDQDIEAKSIELILKFSVFAFSDMAKYREPVLFFAQRVGMQDFRNSFFRSIEKLKRMAYANPASIRATVDTEIQNVRDAFEEWEDSPTCNLLRIIHEAEDVIKETEMTDFVRGMLGPMLYHPSFHGTFGEPIEDIWDTTEAAYNLIVACLRALLEDVRTMDFKNEFMNSTIGRSTIRLDVQLALDNIAQSMFEEGYMEEEELEQIKHAPVSLF